jgi:hypothetical protein
MPTCAGCIRPRADDVFEQERAIRLLEGGITLIYKLPHRFEHPLLGPAVLEHLREEPVAFQFLERVQTGADLFQGAYPDPISALDGTVYCEIPGRDTGRGSADPATRDGVSLPEPFSDPVVPD